MDRSKRLRVVLIIIGVYWGILGGLSIFVFGIAEFLFSMVGNRPG